MKPTLQSSIHPMHKGFLEECRKNYVYVPVKSNRKLKLQ